jgi:hypothetical protein
MQFGDTPESGGALRRGGSGVRHYVFPHMVFLNVRIPLTLFTFIGRIMTEPAGSVENDR